MGGILTTHVFPSAIAISLLPIILFFLIFIIIISSDKSFGFRKLFVRILVKLFESVSQMQHENQQDILEEESKNNNDVPDTTIRKNYSFNNKYSLIEKNISTYGPQIPIAPIKKISSIAENGFVTDSNGYVANKNDSIAKYSVIKEDFQIYHVIDYIRYGIEAIIEDEVTQRFQAEELPTWNLLTRTNKSFYYISPTFTAIWVIGFIIRYTALLPIRVLLFTLGIIWLTFATSIIGMIPNSELKMWLYKHAMLMCFRILARSLTAIITYHNPENMAKPGGICVANHTSPIDVVMLSCDNCYALIGQRHGGFFGFLQTLLSRSTHHVWFERSEMQDRRAVFDVLRDHVSDLNKLPILIFPEGTCINNTSVMMFKKGSFEVGGLIYPAAIKYDPRFGDPFWNSSRQTFLQYLLMMMTSWALVCDIWYLPPMKLEPNEESYHFADRVKAAIALQGGLVDLDWDGELKRAQVKKSWIDNQKYMYSQRLKTE